MPPSDIGRFVLGVGVSASAKPAEAIAFGEQALRDAGLPAERILVVATIASRLGHPVILALAAHFHCDVRGFDAAALEAETPRLKNPSDELFARIGCHGVAEAAALAAAGTEAILVVEKMTGRGMNVAIAM